VGVDDERAIGFHVAERRHLELERSESLGEGNLLDATEMLAGKYEERILQPRRVEIVPRRAVQCGQLDAGHHGAKRGVERLDVECARHQSSCRFKTLELLRRNYRTDPLPVKPSFIEKNLIRN